MKTKNVWISQLASNSLRDYHAKFYWFSVLLHTHGAKKKFAKARYEFYKNATKDS